MRRLAIGLVWGALWVSCLAEPYAYLHWREVPAGHSGGAGIIFTALGGGGIGGYPVEYYGSVQFAQDSGGAMFFAPSFDAYRSPSVSNQPLMGDLIAPDGDSGHQLVFPFAVPRLAFHIVSLGDGGTPVRYVFDRPFTLVSEGTGAYGTGVLDQIDSHTVEGYEGHGTLLFEGPVMVLNWQVVGNESWHGFDIGIPSQRRPVHANLVLQDYAPIVGDLRYRVTLRLRSTTDPDVVETTTGTVDGEGHAFFFTDLPVGDYLLAVKGRQWLRKSMPDPVSLTEDGLRYEPVIELVNGDLDDNNLIDSDDFDLLIGSFGQFGGAGDVNGDQFVDSDDFDILVRNFGLVGDD